MEVQVESKASLLYFAASVHFSKNEFEDCFFQSVFFSK